MDTLTHAFSGVLFGTLVRRPTHLRRDRAWLIAVALAGVFPDIDYLLIFIDPMEFLNWHRGATHSLVLLPLWALLLSLPLTRLLGLSLHSCMVACSLGLLVHILGDWVTLYGTQLFFPLDEHAYALGISFDINPWVAMVTIIGCLIVLIRRSRLGAGITLIVVTALLVGQGALAREAMMIAVLQAAGSGLHASKVRVLPQPLSPFHWGLLITEADGHRVAYLDLTAQEKQSEQSSFLLFEMFDAYRPEDQLVWTSYNAVDSTDFSREAWSRPELSAFRDFAQVPALISADDDANQACAWFTDLRHSLPAIPPAFRYGLCEEADGTSWRAYRLRYFADHDVQIL